MRQGAAVRLTLWLLCLLLLGALVSQRLNLSYDLGLFLPAPQNADQTLLVERLGESPGSRFVLIATDADAETVRTLVQTLGELTELEQVYSDLAPAPETPPEPLMRYRYLLTSTDWSVAGLEQALAARLSELGLGGEASYERLIARDPTLASLAVLDALAVPGSTGWQTPAGERVLIAETVAPAFDLNGQKQALSAIEAILDEQLGGAYRMSGAGVFGVSLQSAIETEARNRTLIASAALIAVLLLLYRSITMLVLAALPLATGVLTGAAAVSLAFDQVHGITLAFGFTLLGVAIDYPLHFLSRARQEAPGRALRATWPTLRLSALSTMLAYGALLIGGGNGMAQLGLFSAAGVAGALLTTRYLLPWLLAERPGLTGVRLANPPGAGPRQRPAVIVLLVVGVVAFSWLEQDSPWWSSDLAALSPVPASQLQEERELREAVGAPSIRYLVATTPGSLEDALTRAAQTAQVLEQAVRAGHLLGFQGPTTLLPPAEQQRARQTAIPDRETLEARLTTALGALPFAAEAFDPFLAEAEASRELPLLSPEAFEGSRVASLLAGRLHQGRDGRWTALFTLRGLEDEAALAESITKAALDERQPGGAADSGARLIDLRATSETLVGDYRRQLLTVLAVVFVLLSLLLTWRLRPGRALWTLLLVLSAVALTASLLRWLFGPLDLYQLTGLLLVAGIGLDYALFLGKRDRASAAHAVFACMASTVAAFSVLAASSIPALHSLGATVALGSTICFGAAWLGSRGERAAR